jgi:hypothetical protein
VAAGRQVGDSGPADTEPGPPDTVTSLKPSAPSKARLSDMTRRGFLRTGSIGVVAAGVVGSVPGLSSLLGTAASDAPVVQADSSAIQGVAPEVGGDTSGVAQAFSAQVKNLSTGEMRLFVGNQTIRIQDADLAQRLSQAARAAQATKG